MSNKDIGAEVQLERSFLKVPVECLNKTFRGSQKNLEKEMNNVLTQITELNKKRETITGNDAIKTIDKLLVRVQKLKRSMEDAKSEEELQIKKLKSRINHLSQATNNQNLKSYRERYNETRVNRIIIDYLLRQSYYDTAIDLTNQLNLKDLIDIEIFLSSKRVVEGLNKFDCTEALNWCNENKSKLKKINSTFEFNIRIQEFIELVKKNKTIEAINYAKTHLSGHSSTNLKEIQQAMATLIFGKDTKCERYRRLLDSQRWSDLVNQFKTENFQLHSLSTRSLLDISLQSGLSVLKTSLCGDHNSANIQCPLCDEAWRKLAISLPVSLQSHSSLVCRISGEIMNDENYPMVLPNGNVYSKNSLVEMREKQGKIIDPRTGDEFKFDELKRAFIS
ncbi:hypothetical protein DICPUDRAFT_151775 [Dictyostelium purpureum]|uniref:Macrophage erythroblast attacher n=1 Tax=Dictyostelium purpureum TaxID=5786 RepID=F0ZJS4_DICPU|nr:uncharacterized protein DICPUDRAFT_151775 [Dictyostelium purpureum]EGC35819.1 hypothetical protein DICPUDRAFT_151775 [Dictyostelium purpureum]|eukprot:XP_003287656.1 hypothetical protein DICPUDRAFT_151775 [Dictyostelium purpureum]